MLRVVVAPRWLAAHLLMVLAVVLCVRLGLWQLHSYQAQQDDAASAVVSAAPVPLDRVASLSAPLARDGVVVTTAGRYDTTQQLVVAGVRLQGRQGYAVVTPLRLASGAVLPVVRGWSATADAAARTVPTGRVDLRGVLQRNDADPGTRTSVSTPAGAQIAAVSSEELLRRLPYPPSQVYDAHLLLLDQRPAQPGALAALPAPRRHAGVSAWRNLAYSIQWDFFAAAAVWLWAVSLRGAVRDRAAGA